jgi:hypothetical protein
MATLQLSLSRIRPTTRMGMRCCQRAAAAGSARRQAAMLCANGSHRATSDGRDLCSAQPWRSRS